jgi:protein gp37
MTHPTMRATEYASSQQVQAQTPGESNAVPRVSRPAVKRIVRALGANNREEHRMGSSVESQSVFERIQELRTAGDADSWPQLLMESVLLC